MNTELYAYATHLPILRSLGAILPIKRVLEFGAGLYSTPTFLDRTVFPHLEKLISVEDDWEWLQRVKDYIGSPQMRAHWPDAWSRLSLRYGSPEKSMLWVDTDDYDLIFIDSGRTIADRIPIIEAIAARKPSCVVVIHDFEQWDYQHAARGLTGLKIYSDETPWTAVFMPERVTA